MKTLILIFLGLLPVWAVPTVPHSSSCSAGSQTTVSVACTLNSVTTGNVIVLYIGWKDNAGSAPSFSASTSVTSGYSNLGGTWTSNSASGSIFCGLATSSGNESVTVSGVAFQPSSTAMIVHVIEVSGTNGCSLDGSFAGQRTNISCVPGTSQAGTVTTTLANSILINGVFVNSSSLATIPTSTYTQIINSTLSGVSQGTQYLVVSAGAYNPAITVPCALEAGMSVALQPTSTAVHRPVWLIK